MPAFWVPTVAPLAFAALVTVLCIVRVCIWGPFLMPVLAPFDATIEGAAVVGAVVSLALGLTPGLLLISRGKLHRIHANISPAISIDKRMCTFECIDG